VLIYVDCTYVNRSFTSYEISGYLRYLTRVSYLGRAGVMPQIAIIVTKLDSLLEIVFHKDVANTLP